MCPMMATRRAIGYIYSYCISSHRDQSKCEHVHTL